MTVSVKRMSAGDGYRYLMKTVAVGDARLQSPASMTRYYTESGTPAGRWVGGGLAGLGNGRGIGDGQIVTEEQLFHLIGMGNDPLTGDALGSAPQRAASTNRQPEVSGSRKAVTGFDLTFSAPKSVSAVWAVADAETQRLIIDAHRAAIRDALQWAEREVFATRVGKGGSVRVPVRGVVAAAFDHWDSRANDPHLHTHVVVANRVQTAQDDRWRTLDSRGLYRAAVALSEFHQGLLMDRITQLLGVGWDGRARRHSATLQWEITGVPNSVRDEFSRRAKEIDTAKDDLVETYRAKYGRSPDLGTVLKLRQQATLATRPEKVRRTLEELTEEWRERASRLVGSSTESWVRSLPRTDQPPTNSHGVTGPHVHRLARQALAAVADKRATFTRWNVFAEAQRQIHGLRLTTAVDREQIAARITDSALGLALLLRPRDRTPEKDSLQPDSTSRYTTHTLFDAEERLLDAGRDALGPLISDDRVLVQVQTLSPEQQAVIAQIATSGRTLDVLVGAAGTGKTATMAGLATTWIENHGPGSVIGLAPSAAAADVLGDELRLPTENTAKWISESGVQPHRIARLEHLRAALDRVPARSPHALRIEAAMQSLATEVDRWRFKSGQLVIIDEASLAGTIALDTITTAARAAQAKLLLVGDPAQLSPVAAGGAFGMLVRDRGEAPELFDVRRFDNEWERQASLAIRAGDDAAIDLYANHGRVHQGSRNEALDNAYAAWLADQLACKNSLLIAADAASTIDLNIRARSDLAAAGLVSAAGVQLPDGTVAGRGDRIVTRRNDRTIPTGRGWVKNGDAWLVRDEVAGALVVRSANSACEVKLPADYVREHVELGYATTAHRSQGRTVDTAHALVSAATTRETLYVSLTRGRSANHAYVVLGSANDVEEPNDHHECVSGCDVLRLVIANSGAESSAHETLSSGKRNRPLTEGPAAHLDLLPNQLCSRVASELDESRRGHHPYERSRV